MESITKNRQPADTLRAMVGAAYGADDVPEGDDFAEELGHGWFNVAYRIRLRSGRDVVLKIAPPPEVSVMTYERGMMRNELAALALVQEHSAVPVPPVEFADTSGRLVAADWFFMPFVDGDNLGVAQERGAVDPAVAAAYNEQLGAMNRELNEIAGPHFGPLQGPGFATWREAFTAMIGDVLDDGERAGVDLGFAYDQLRVLVAGEAESLDDVVEPRFVEWDLWSTNALVRDGRIVSIIDHERAFYGDPLIEAGFTGLDLASFGSSDDFVRGYGKEPLTDAEARRRRLYTLYLVLIMTIETRYRGHADTSQYDWARERLAEVMSAFDRVG